MEALDSVAIRLGAYPMVTVEEALGSESARGERDLQLAAWLGLQPAEVGPFLRRLELFDQRTPVYEARVALERILDLAERSRRVVEQTEAWRDSREGLLVRMDAVIADLVDQLDIGGQEPA